MWKCPYCFTEMLTTSRCGHLRYKQGCSQQHALHLAKEAKKKEEQKQKQKNIEHGLLQATGALLFFC